MTRAKTNSFSRVSHLKIVSKVVEKGVHLILILPRVDVVLVPILEEHISLVVNSAID